MDDLLLLALLCPGQHSVVGRHDPVAELDWCDSSVGGRDSVVSGRDPSLERLLGGRDPDTVDTRDPDCLLPLLVTPPPFVLPVLPEADDLADNGRLLLVLFSLFLLAT